ncbi:hypothetical protein DFJ73DRAFT_948089 [Zopfochytrium polystomum]|nr:hypothetical protein DFJ73DRAFT_948089 [Zopfochytrium polystomum]
MQPSSPFSPLTSSPPQGYNLSRLALNGFCELKHESQANDQSENTIKEYLELFKSVVENSAPGENGSDAYGFSSDQLSRIRAAISCLAGDGGTGSGGRIVEHNALELQLHLCALDGWKYSPQLAQNQTVHHSAAPSRPMVIAGETVPNESKNEILRKFDELLKNAKRRIEDDRSAAHGSQGHQRTPSFIKAILSQAVDTIFANDKVGEDKLCDLHLPCGGTTDVGLHTGGLPRNTSYHLVVSMMGAFLRDPYLIEKLLLHKYLFVFEHHYQPLQESAGPFDPRGVNECVVLLDNAAQSAQWFTPEQALGNLQPFALLNNLNFVDVDRWYSNSQLDTINPAFCLTASATVAQFFFRSSENLQDHAFCTSPTDVLDDKMLEVLSLRDKSALRASANVRNYIRTVNKGKRGTLFSVTEPESTIEFARLYAAEDSQIKEFWREELREAERKESCHFSRVQTKQAAAAARRAEISELKMKIASKEDELASISERQAQIWPTQIHKAEKLLLKVPRDYGPSSVDDICSETQCSWYPDFSSTITSLGVTESGAVSEVDRIEYFVEKLPHDFQKEDFLLLGMTRSFPNQQFRKVVEILTKLTFPLQHPLAVTTLCQALYQLGEANELGELDWRKDWNRCEDRLHAALMGWVDLFQASSKRHAGLPLVAEIAEFSAQHLCAERFGALLQKLCEAALVWAAEIRNKLRDTTLDAVSLRHLRARECLMMGHAVLCHSRSTVDVLSTANFTKTFATFRAILPYGSFDKLMARTLRKLEIMALELSARRFETSTVLAEKYPDVILTSAARAVFDQLPMILKWQRFDSDSRTGCFYAEANDDIVSMNLLDGVVHLNGLPPAGLPGSVKDTAFYKRHFGNRDFEVFRAGFSFGTALPIYGDHFRFCVCEHERIRIRQLPAAERDWEHSLELIDFNCRPRVVCDEYAGYFVDNIGSLDNFLRGFYHYLVLRSTRSDQNVKLVVPNGPVFVRDSKTAIEISDRFDAEIGHFVYDLRDSLDIFTSTTLAARLQLAAIYAAAGCEAALEIVRQNWTNKPLSPDETSKLTSILQFAYPEPALFLAACELGDFSERSAFLFAPSKEATMSVSFRNRMQNMIATVEYEHRFERPQWENGLRQFLPHHRSTYTSQVLVLRNEEMRPQPLKVCPVNAQYIQDRECALKDLLVRKGRSMSNTTANRPFPLEVMSENRVEDLLYRDLKRSWDSFCHADSFQLPSNIDRLKADIEGKLFSNPICSYLIKMFIALANSPDILADVRRKRNATLSYVEGVFKQAEARTEFDLRLQTNRAATPLFTDYLRIAMQQEALGWLHPYLNSEQKGSVRRDILVLLGLGVLEDKLVRIRNYLDDPPSRTHAIRELLAVREWDIEKFYFWLVFEVETGLQIRPEQYLIAKHMIDTPQAICQLNMGLGKTRVILPMLILYYTNACARRQNSVLRINILQALIPEAVLYLTSVFAASVIPLKICLLPFHRDVKISLKGVKILHETLKMLWDGGGCVVVSPEQRLSLQLKCNELQYGEDPLWKGLSNVLSTPFLDIIDESDEVLSHKYHLVYAIGSPCPLDDGFKRWTVAESIFRVVAKLAPQFSALGIWNQAQKNTGFAAGSFPEIKVKQTVNQYQVENWKLLSECIFDELLANPPHRLAELRSLGEDSKAQFRKYVLTTSLEASRNQFAGNAEIGLALRGFLCHGLLRYVLQLRHRVNYGIDERRSAKKLAVPYRAADVPSDRAEFSHPDVSISLTYLSFYYTGLTVTEFKEAENFETVNFWLQSCVFPRDTTQYKKRIAATAWDLASSKHCSGFSGTNDSYPLLPLQVEQNDPKIDLIIGTNGLMLDRILRETLSYMTVETGDTAATMWQLLLLLCTANHANALIDAGSLLAGTDNEGLARFIVKDETFPSKFRGVCYFDVSKQCWMILNKETLESSQKEVSSIPERDTFVLFDDARTRGADMKLPHDAVAVLTLGPGIVKDKLMQGAGRMRLLGSGQKLILCGTSEVTASLLSRSVRNVPTVELVLKMMIRNTAERIIAGMPLWAQNGLRFDDNQHDPDNCMLDEKHALDLLYTPPASSRLLTSHIEEMVESRKRAESEIQGELVRRAHIVAEGVEVQVLGCDEECERELQQEKERQTKLEKQLPLEQPAVELTWNYAIATRARRAKELNEVSEAVPLSFGLQGLIGSSAAHISWDPSVYATANFLNTIQVGNDETNRSLYLRPVMGVVVFNSTSEIVLLSDKEADGVLNAFHSAPFPRDTYVSFCYLSDLWKWTEDGSQPCPATSVGCRNWKALSPSSAASAKLLNGETMYGSIAGSLKHLLRSRQAEKVARELVEWRRKEDQWECSDLQAMCRSI